VSRDGRTTADTAMKTTAVQINKFIIYKKRNKNIYKWKKEMKIK
jgi:hypothetical protein